MKIVSNYISSGCCTAAVGAYPQNSINVIAKLMKEINLNSIPVFESPWNKKIIGILKYDAIKELVS